MEKTSQLVNTDSPAKWPLKGCMQYTKYFHWFEHVSDMHFRLKLCILYSRFYGKQKQSYTVIHKLALLVYKCRQGVAPPYLADELCQPADTEARCRLCSASASSLIVRRTRLSTVGDRAFPVAGPRIWNSLPQHVTSAPSLAIFRSRLKTHLFRRCFPWLHRSLVVPEKWHFITDTLIVFVTYLLTALSLYTLY